MCHPRASGALLSGDRRPVMQLSTPFRRAVPEDAPAVATFFDMANDGLRQVLWRIMCQSGEKPDAVGLRVMTERIKDGDAVVTDEPGAPLAGMISKAQPGREDLLPNHLPPQGLGGALLGLAEDMPRDAGLSAMSLLVLAHNTGARRLYETLGYVEAARDWIEQDGWAPVRRTSFS